MLKRTVLIIIASIFLSSCTSVPAVQGRIRHLASRGDFDYAAQFVSRLKFGVYGKNNRLLEVLDRGMVFHYAGKYQKSIEVFEDAKRVYDELYTKSLSKFAATWLWNDAALPYPGEDFERVMINIFQSLNFIALGEYDEALVEARNVQSVLQLINDRYSSEQKNVYADDAFARMLMGILYESFGERQDLNNAFISYKKAFDIYRNNYSSNYSVSAPELLKEKLLLSAEWMGKRELQDYRKKFPDIDVKSLHEGKDSAEVYLVFYRGQIINKVQSSILLPGMDGLLTRVSFPKYRKSFKSKRVLEFHAESAEGGKVEAVLRKVQDLDAIARENLKNRKVRILAKAVARPLTKQLLVEAVEDKVRDKAGDAAGDLFNYTGNFYLLYSEQADLRAWETLPSEIYFGRLLLTAGEYQFFADGEKIADFSVSSGDKKFIMHWSGY